MTILLFILSFLQDDNVQEARRPQPTPATREYMLNCVEQGNSKVACYYTYWDAYQFGYGLEMPVVVT